MTELTQIEQKRIGEIEQLMTEIEIETDCTPNMIGAINSVAASGGEPTEEAIKLLILEKRNLLNQDEYLEMVLYFSQTRKR